MRLASVFQKRSVKIAILFTFDAMLMVGDVVGLFAWGLRDGLGQYAVESTGVEAVRKAFFTFNWGPVFMPLLLVGITAHFVLKPDKGIPNLTILFWVAFVFTFLIQYIAAEFLLWSPS